MTTSARPIPFPVPPLAPPAPPAWHWLRDLADRFPAESREFASCFERIDGPSPGAWVAIGRLATIVCDVRDGAVVSRLEAGSRILSRQVSSLDDAELPYEKIFSALGSFLRTGRTMLASRTPWWDAADARALQWFGGWKYAPTAGTVRNACCFTLPKLAIRLDASGVRIFNWGGLAASLLADLPRAPLLATARPRDRPVLVDDRMLPDRADYLRAAQTVLRALSLGRCQKVVLGRKRVLELSQPLDALDVYERITRQGGHAFQYLMSLDDDETWVGISPELLLRTSAGGIETRPLAGSRRRGSSPAHDASERESLLTSDKDAREHDLAADHLFRRLQWVCEGDSLSVTEGRAIAKLSYIQHLATEMKGRLDRAYDAVDALARIYPPATILGIPDRAAAEVLQSCEAFDRSFFTGGIGVLSANGDCDIALCIRSAAVKGHELHLYAGSGYVEGSSPEDEWSETQAKMHPFLDVAAALLDGER